MDCRQNMSSKKQTLCEQRRFNGWPNMNGRKGAVVSLQHINEYLSENLPNAEGLEFHQFRIGSYHATIDPAYRTPYSDDTLAVVVINTPAFFDGAFKHWLQLKRSPNEGYNEFIDRFGSNPIQKFFIEKFSEMQKRLAPIRMDVFHDFDFDLNRKPMFLMTVCGHVAGAAYFYRPSEIIPNSTHPNRLMGLSLHPKYGGHFAFRVVLVFPDVDVTSDFIERKPVMLLKTVDEQLRAIKLFNSHWRDGRFRDCGDPIERYSDLQIRYYNLPASERWPLIMHWFENGRTQDECD